MKLALQSERYAATGNISGAGIRRTLGTPTLDQLQILIREAVQNAWDARRDDLTTVGFSVRIRTLSTSQRGALATLFDELPVSGSTSAAITGSLQKNELSIIEIMDEGTTGLGGPVRADEDPKGDDRPDFVNFFRNIGSARDREMGGGTYGYGKSSLFRISRCGTLIGYTRTSVGGRSTTRLIASSLGEEFEHRRVRYTGRHWWGKRADDGIVDPVTGAAADAVAASLGMKRRAPDEFGTSLLVIDPDFDERTPLQAANAVVECLLWFFWPKMLNQPHGHPAMRFDVRLDDQPIPIPEIRRFPPLSIFGAAMAAAKGENATRIRCEKPIRLLGTLGLAKGPKQPRVHLDTGSVALVPEQSACVALMRPAELVVKYLATPAITSDMVEYAGVFICDRDVEASFAAAEPPAHDDWIPDFLERPGKVFVNVALKRIQESAARFANPVTAESIPAEQHSLGAIADALGDLLLGQVGTRLNGAEPDGKRGRSSEGVPHRPDIVITEPVPFGFAEVRRTPCALFRLHVSSSLSAATLVARPLIVLEGGATEFVDDEEGPCVVGWLGAKGEMMSRGPEVRLHGTVDDWLHVAVSVQVDAAVAIEVSVAERG